MTTTVIRDLYGKGHQTLLTHVIVMHLMDEILNQNARLNTAKNDRVPTPSY